MTFADASRWVRRAVAETERVWREEEAMETKTLTLAEFLLARIAEDEAAAHRAVIVGNEFQSRDGLWHVPSDGEWEDIVDSRDREIAGAYPHEGGGVHTTAIAEHMARHDPARVLAECGAKRRIVGRYSLLLEQAAMPGGEVFGYHATGLGIAVKFLAITHDDHPDFREEWRL